MRYLLILSLGMVLNSFGQSNEPCPTTPVPVNPDFGCANTTFGTVIGATASPQSTTACAGSEDDDIWFSFVATDTEHRISLINVFGSDTDLFHSLWEGPCTALTLVPGTCSDLDESNVSGLTIGATYYIRVYTVTATGGQTTFFNLCVGTNPPPPSNDECTGAISLTVNSDLNCGATTSGTTAGASQSPQDGTSCLGTENDDVWFSFVATQPTHVINISNIAGTTTNLNHSVWEGTCPALTLVAGSCSDPNVSILSGLTIGQTYYIRVYTLTGAILQSTTFDICLGTIPPPPTNDDCSGAINIPLSTYGNCTNTSGSIAGATGSSQTNGCAGTANDDVWYSFTAPSTGAVNITISNVINDPGDLFHSVYINNCGTPGAAIVCSDPNTSLVTGLTSGASYLIRIFSQGNTIAASTNFDVCLEITNNCGTPQNQDFCIAPAILTEGGASFSSNTSGTYTTDMPANLISVFCGSIENNSWYEFVANTTTESFPISFVGGTGCTNGIQGAVYDVTTDINECCTNFTPVSNCYSPGNLTLDTISATGLTPGNTYLLMIDGFAGAVCDFTISGWSATGILPVELMDFNGIGLPNRNALTWRTKSERNNDYFIVQKSIDGINFTSIGQLEGAGNSNTVLNYRFDDEDTRIGITYYRLLQVDFDGTTEESKIIALNREANKTEITAIYPNPTNDIVHIQYNSNEFGSLKLMNIEGKILESKLLKELGVGNIDFDLSSIESGVYFISLQTQNGVISTHKILKK